MCDPQEPYKMPHEEIALTQIDRIVATHYQGITSAERAIECIAAVLANYTDPKDEVK